MSELSTRWTWVLQLSLLSLAFALLGAWCFATATAVPLGLCTTLALVLAARAIPLSVARIEDGTIELERPGVSLNLGLDALTGVERAGGFGHRIRLHFDGDSPLGHSTIIMLPWRGLNRVHPMLDTLRRDICRAHQERGAAKVVVDHRRRREGDRLGGQGRQRLVEQFRALQRSH